MISGTETPNAADQQYILRRYVEALEELRDDGLVYWEANAIPAEVFLAVVYFMGLVVSSGFNKPTPPDLDAALEAAKRRIRRRISKRSTGEATMLSEY